MADAAASAAQARPAAPNGTAAGPMRHRRFSTRIRDASTGYLFILPALAVFAVFVFYPLVKTIYLGFYQTPPFPNLPSKYVGLSQYRHVLSSSSFLDGLRTTVQFVLLTVPIGVVLGLALAVLAHKRLSGIRIFRTVFSSTVATSTAVASVIFFTLLDPQVGLLSYWLGQQGGSGILQSPTWALPAVSVTTIWQNLGFTFILMSAALQSIPDDLLEAASVDGSRSAATFWRVTFPLLSPMLFFAAVIGVIAGFQAFGQIDILTQGGPEGHTTTLVYYLYQSAFQQNDTGTAAVIAVALFVILLVLTLVQFRFVNRRVFYAD
jgi:sn-glycerol 3-phosphate transport system permease protein